MYSFKYYTFVIANLSESVISPASTLENTKTFVAIQKHVTLIMKFQ